MSREIEYMPLMRTGLAIRMDLLNEQQAKRNHGQTLTRLKERGGLSPCEALAIAEHRVWKRMRLDDCMQALQVLADNAKPLPEPIKMTNARPASTGWYWYELPGSWPLQPVLVFDGGPGYGLMYALDKIDLDHDDGNRDGFCIDICEVNSLWSTRPIESPNKEVAIGAEK